MVIIFKTFDNLENPIPPPCSEEKLLIKLKVWEKPCLTSKTNSGKDVIKSEIKKMKTCLILGSFLDTIKAIGMEIRVGIKAI